MDDKRLEAQWLEGLHWSNADCELVEQDLGREPRGVVGVGARRQSGHPMVVVTAPRLPNGTPFPTTFYLTDAAVTAACSRLEADLYMETLNEELQDDPDFAAQHRAAHDDYLARRADVARHSGTGEVPEVDGISAGGLPNRVKCLHALVGHALVAGPGINPAGDRALLEMRRRGLIGAEESFLSADDLAERARMQRVAAIDCGTNSIRLLIADLSPDPQRPFDLTDVLREMTITRLGQGVDKTGRLNLEAVKRTLAAAEHYQEQLETAGVQSLRIAATSAMRDAENRDAFLDGMRTITGLTPEVISGQEEASLSFIGAVSSLPEGLEPPYLVVDIGGGSTEFVLGTDSAEQSVSVDMGSVRVTERFGPEPWDEEKQAAAREWIDELLDEAEAQVDFQAAKTVVGVAGTITSLAALICGVAEYSPEVTHGFQPTSQQWMAALDTMITDSVGEKAKQPAMPPGRADVIGGGALIWERILVRLGTLSDGDEGGSNTPGVEKSITVVVSEHDILDGLALSLRR